MGSARRTPRKFLATSPPGPSVVALQGLLPGGGNGLPGHQVAALDPFRLHLKVQGVAKRVWVHIRRPKGTLMGPQGRLLGAQCVLPCIHGTHRARLGKPKALFWQPKALSWQTEVLFWRPKAPLWEPKVLLWQPKASLSESMGTLLACYGKQN